MVIFWSSTKVMRFAGKVLPPFLFQQVIFENSSILTFLRIKQPFAWTFRDYKRLRQALNKIENRSRTLPTIECVT